MAYWFRGRGFTTVMGWAGPGTTYGLIGPFTYPRIIERLAIHWTFEVAGTFGLAASVGCSGEASVAALMAGTPVVERSDRDVSGVPAVSMVGGASSSGSFIVPVGVRTHSGARWIVLGLGVAGVGSTGFVGVGVEMLELD